MKETLSYESISTKLQKIATLAKGAPEMVVTTLSHHIDRWFLKEAYRRTHKSGAVGIDGQTAKEYAVALDANLESLLNRFKSGNYKAPAVKRRYIPKGDGKSTRPIGIPTLEDKILQRAVTMVLEAVYEQDFLPCSYGFRPQRSAHDALEAIWQTITKWGDVWILEVDIKSFFDTIDHTKLREILDERIKDGIIRRTIDKWLKAGVMEDGITTHPETGTPQGGVISPLLANIYLHHVLDKWLEEMAKPRLRGKAELIRYADDFVILFTEEMDARRVYDVLPKRLAKYGLSIHPEKTKLIHFRHPKKTDTDTQHASETFDFLGFTHYWGKSRKGTVIVKRKTSKKRLARTIKALREWCKTNRHLEIRRQAEELRLKLRGHYQYFGITNNMRALKTIFHLTERIWHTYLSRRSQKAYLNWTKMKRILARYPLPAPRIYRSIYNRTPELPFNGEPVF